MKLNNPFTVADLRGIFHPLRVAEAVFGQTGRSGRANRPAGGGKWAFAAGSGAPCAQDRPYPKSARLARFRRVRRRALPQTAEKRGSNKKQGVSKSSLDDAFETHRELLEILWGLEMRLRPPISFRCSRRVLPNRLFEPSSETKSLDWMDRGGKYVLGSEIFY